MSRIIFDIDSPVIKHKMSLLDEWDELEGITPTSVASYRKAAPKESEEPPEDYGDDWLRTVATFKQEPIKATRRSSGGGFLEYLEGGKKKKKKKKKEENEPTDYNKEFENEVQLLQNLLTDQSRFTDSLQKRYDILESSKGTARGVGKFTTDLIGQINQGRSLSAQLVNNLVSVKKTIVDLTMKEKKELAAHNSLDGENLSEFSADLLKRMLKQSRNDAELYGDDAPVDGTVEDIFHEIEGQLADSDRSPEVDILLQYEKRNVTVYAVVDPDTNEYRLEAIADDDEVLEDYPLPEVESLEVNRSTETATDEYHNKYPIRWEKM